MTMLHTVGVGDKDAVTNTDLKTKKNYHYLLSQNKKLSYR